METATENKRSSGLVLLIKTLDRPRFDYEGYWWVVKLDDYDQADAVKAKYKNEDEYYILPIMFYGDEELYNKMNSFCDGLNRYDVGVDAIKPLGEILKECFK